jgi:thiol:disulfide interchange protein DsbC
VSVVVYSPANAKDGCAGECASCHKLTKNEAQELLKKTGGTVTSIKQAPIRGMFELFMEKDGKQGVIYIDYAKKNFMQGFIVNFETLKKVSAHDMELPQPKQTTYADPKTIPIENAFVMGNPQGAKKIYVFTDPDCPYCRQLHVELKKLTKLVPDLALFIMLYPLPIHHDAYDKSRAILTFKNQIILDKAFKGVALPAIGTKDGSKELNEIINYARRTGISITPSIVLQDGRVISGFKSAEELKDILAGTK